MSTNEKMKRILLILCLAAATATAAPKTPKASKKAPVRVACVGNSVTYGMTIENREQNCYPARLQELLGEGYEVANFGHSGSTLLKKGHRPYVGVPEYEAALAFAAERVVIHLGLNDTDPRDWPDYSEDFIRDYLDLIASFREANPACRVWICRMTPIFHNHRRFKSGTRDWFWQEQEAIEQVARIAGVPLIDLHEGLYSHPNLLPDALHPNAEGAGILARTVYGALTGDYGGLQLPAPYTDGMVLQCERPLRIAGRADAGEEVTVRIAGQQQRATAGSDGKWAVVLEPLAASREPLVLECATPKRRLVFKDVLAGDVWLCSGQSNMAFRLNESVASEQEAQRAWAAGNPAVRLFDMKPRRETFATSWDAGILDSIDHLQYYHDTAWQPCTPATAARFSAVGVAFGRMLADSLEVPIGLICNAVGGSPTEAWVDRKTLEFEFPDILYNWTGNDLIQDWVRSRGALNTKNPDNIPHRHPFEPCYLYEAGIAPLEAYPIKGVIWYQGESNAHNIEAHERLFALLTRSWRSTWGDDELPVYYVQLSGITRPSWPRFRDSQRRLLERVPATGMAVSSDWGDSLNVHPIHKQPVGERLARWALNRTYGRSGVTPSGPLFRKAESYGGAIYVTFDYGAGMRSADGGALRTFEVAEHDGLFVPARAEVTPDGRVKVWSDEVANPRFVRYGWQPFTRANLVNSDALPASTFRGEVSGTTHPPVILDPSRLL